METFRDKYNMEEPYRSQMQQIIIITYFSFTSLSTVGLGDYSPRSDYERLLCSIILLFGVAIFSYIMTIFLDILIDYRKLNNELEDD